MNGGYCEEPPFAPPWPKIGVVSSAVVYESMLCAVLINFALYGELIIAHIAESRPYSVFGEGKKAHIACFRPCRLCDRCRKAD